MIAILKALLRSINWLLFRADYVCPEKFPTQGPAIIVSNHQHTFDVFLIHAKVTPWIYWVSKKELTEKPIIGRLVKRLGVIPVDRDKSDLSAARSMFERIKEGRVIGIFPQGTRMKSKEMISKVIPKTGAVHFAIRSGTPIYPVGIKGDFRLFRKMKIIAGDPITPEELNCKIKGDNRLMRQSIYIMKRVYELAGIEYKIEDDIVLGDTHDC